MSEVSDHQPEAISGIYYDGTSSRKRRVTLDLTHQLEISEDGQVLASWPYDRIRRADSVRTLRLSCLSALPLARLEVDNPVAAQEVIARCPALDAGGPGGRQTWRIVGWSVAAAVSIVLVTVFGLPVMADRLAPMVPEAVEKRIGDAVDRQVRALIGQRVCERAEGQAAFTKMVDKIKDAAGIDIAFEARVLESTVPNAFALPGGKIYLLSGLLEKAKDVDEVAGVIAHELGHAQHRDGMRRIIQTGGSSFLIGLLFGDIMGGGAVLFAARSILDASYSREAEMRADGVAIAAMNGLGRSPRPLGELLVRMTGGSRVSTIVDSHPVSAERLDRMKAAEKPVTGAPILSAVEWQALKDICK